MYLAADVWYFILIIAIGFSFNVTVLCEANNTFINHLITQAEESLVKKNIATHLLLNDIIAIGNDIWNSTNNTECYNQIQILRSAFHNNESWAIEMLDASSIYYSRHTKLKSTDHESMYSRCSSINTKMDNDNIMGRYCIHNFYMKWESNVTADVEIAICYPYTCAEKHINNILIELGLQFSESTKNDNLTIYYSPAICVSAVSEPFSKGEITTIIILSILGCFLTISTICDIILRIFLKQYNTQNRYLILLSEFSLYKNSIRILSTKMPHDNLSVICGLRYFSMCWVILQHSHESYFLTTYEAYLTWTQTWISIYYLLSGFAVDTFFTISGCLVSYLFLNNMSKNKNFNLIQYYIHRYIRLTPAVGAILALTIFIFPRFGSGIKWNVVMNSQKDECSIMWWPTLLYVHNYVETEHMMCLNHLWYLAVDMQLFWISPFIMYPLLKKPKIGLIILTLLLIVSIITPAVVAAKYKYSNASLLEINTNPLSAAINLLAPTYCRAGPWLMGIYLGYILAGNKYRNKTILIKLAWISIVLSFGFIFFSYRYYQSLVNDNHYINVYWESFYSGFSHHIWALGVCCLIFVSSYGHGGIISKFLSHPIFIPLSKISYSVYIVHAMMLQMIFSYSPVDNYITNINLISEFFSMLIWSFIGGFIFSLIFETPFILLEKIWLGKMPVPSNIKADTSNDVIKIN